MLLASNLLTLAAIIIFFIIFTISCLCTALGVSVLLLFVELLKEDCFSVTCHVIIICWLFT